MKCAWNHFHCTSLALSDHFCWKPSKNIPFLLYAKHIQIIPSKNWSFDPYRYLTVRDGGSFIFICGSFDPSQTSQCTLNCTKYNSCNIWRNHRRVHWAWIPRQFSTRHQPLEKTSNLLLSYVLFCLTYFLYILLSLFHRFFNLQRAQTELQLKI